MGGAEVGVCSWTTPWVAVATGVLCCAKGKKVELVGWLNVDDERRTEDRVSE